MHLLTLGLVPLLSFFFVSAQAAVCEVPHASYGALKSEMAQKHHGTWVLLKDVAITKNTIGYGPGGNTAFEATFYDGKVWLANADDTKPNGVMGWHDYAQAEGNVFAVTATANAWLPLQKLDGVFDVDELNMVLDEAVESLGCQTALLPFTIEGIAKSVSWSIESNPDKKTGRYENEPVIIVGIYASAKRDEFFAMPNTNIHLHAIFPNQGFAGHVTQVSLEPGAKLRLGQ